MFFIITQLYNGSIENITGGLRISFTDPVDHKKQYLHFKSSNIVSTILIEWTNLFRIKSLNIKYQKQSRRKGVLKIKILQNSLKKIPDAVFGSRSQIFFKIFALIAGKHLCLSCTPELLNPIVIDSCAFLFQFRNHIQNNLKMHHSFFWSA